MNPTVRKDEALQLLDAFLDTAAPAETLDAAALAQAAGQLQAIRQQLREVQADLSAQKPVRWFNGCNETVPQALRYLADHERPIGGEERFNSLHLFQLADEIERMAEKPLYASAGVLQTSAKDEELSALKLAVGTLRSQLASATAELARQRSDVNWPFSSNWRVTHYTASSDCTDEFNQAYAWGVERTEAPYCDKQGRRLWTGPTLAQAMRTACQALNLALEPCAK
jgi:hypothetical protein